MSILKKSQLLGYRNIMRTYSKSITESLGEFKNESRIGRKTIFLSHKHDEMEALDATISFLKNFGVNIYVDWQDGGMPKNTSGITAKRIKEKIEENDKFILLATEAAISSKWCNWELGFGDSHKYIDNIAVFPIKDNYSDFSGSEYLQIYPRIEYVEEYSVPRKIGGYFPSGYYVIIPPDNNGTSHYIKIAEWLRR